jgi:hypothetical protein
MRDATFRSVVVLGLLAGALLVMRAPRWLGLPDQHTDPGEAGFTYVTDIDYWQRTERQQWVKTTVPFDPIHDLGQVPLQLGDWRGEDVPETNLEVFMLLEPEQFVQRRYRDGAGHSLWLTLIGGRASRSFHPPDLCYHADGWQVSLSSRVIPLDGGGEIHGLWLEAHKQEDQHMVFFFYLFPDSERDQSDGMMLFKLTSAHHAGIEETLAIQSDFLSQLFSQARPTR